MNGKPIMHRRKLLAKDKRQPKHHPPPRAAALDASGAKQYTTQNERQIKMNYKQNDRVLVKGIPATVVRHENYQLPNGKIISSVRVQVFDANKGWQEFDADESIVEPDNSKNQ